MLVVVCLVCHHLETAPCPRPMSKTGTSSSQYLTHPRLRAPPRLPPSPNRRDSAVELWNVFPVCIYVWRNTQKEEIESDLGLLQVLQSRPYGLQNPRDQLDRRKGKRDTNTIENTKMGETIERWEKEHKEMNSTENRNGKRIERNTTENRYIGEREWRYK